MNEDDNVKFIWCGECVSCKKYIDWQGFHTKEPKIIGLNKAGFCEECHSKHSVFLTPAESEVTQPEFEKLIANA